MESRREEETERDRGRGVKRQRCRGSERRGSV